MIKSQFTLKQLEAFVFVVDIGTFRGAATALGTTQPNVSARIKALEEALGKTILVRDAGSVRLTESGEVLLQKARDVLWAGEALIEEAERQDLIDERLRLGVTELVACSWLREFLRLLKEAYPNLRIELEVDLSVAIDLLLREGKLDLALQTEPFPTQISGTEHLVHENYCWVTVPDIAQHLGAKPALDDLFEYPILTHAKHSLATRSLHQIAEERGLNVGRIAHSNALSACVPMVTEGLGIALLPHALVRSEIKSGALQVIETDWLPDALSFHARYHADRAPLYVQKAVEFAKQAIKQDS
ncbi:LysR family transcriptional regulator [Planktotalea sp.]|uniref:LysR family transcriptional regulator n=1 Tax=Planktotalea sp. TaxID=2029877 RepID=UPI003297CBAE